MSELELYNIKAKEQNTKAFKEVNKREPKDYNEVLKWVDELIEKAKTKEDYKEVTIKLIKVTDSQEVYRVC